MQDWRHGEYLRTLPALIRRAGRNPFPAFELCLTANVGLLFWRTVDEEEPGIEAARAERWSYPAADESEIACVEMKIVVFQKRGPGHARGLQIVKQRRPLTLR